MSGSKTFGRKLTDKNKNNKLINRPPHKTIALSECFVVMMSNQEIDKQLSILYAEIKQMIN